ncbi:MAG: class I SAM-dependent methyltransferase [Thomasclavelia sp.]|jgi:16S rRNA (guanine1207-N2)-methyltransferase|nr:class I SAM-dependent methyltransferase [Thomasclavelia sp.]
MKHYYTNNDDLESNEQTFTYNYDKYNLLFTTDNGVFSKQMIDYGSRVILDNVTLDGAKSLLDVGCGYGTFGVCFKKRYKQLEVDMVDVNDRAMKLASHNAKMNNVEVNIFKSNAYENVEKSYDVIITNPPIRAGKQVVTNILVNSYEHLNKDGKIYVVIQKKQGAPSAKKKLTEVFGNCEVVKRDKGYYLLVSKK